MLTFACAIACAGPMAQAAPPVESVRGHGVWDLDQDYVINQISINAWRDESGVHGNAIWMSNYFFANNERGWIWYLRVVDMYYIDETTIAVDCIIEFDNRYPVFSGPWTFTLQDNGDGANDPPDELMG